jgi:putative transposase
MHPPKPLSGDTVERVTATPTANGLGPADVAMQVTLQTRDDGGFPEKGPRRGAKSKPAKAPKARAKIRPEPVETTKPVDPFRKTSDAFSSIDLREIENLSWVANTKKAETK